MKRVHVIFLILWVLGAGVVSLAAAQSKPDDVSAALDNFGHMTAGQQNAVLGSIGLSDPSAFAMPKIIAWIIFGAIGFGVFMYGKKERSIKPLIIGIALMGYPYFVNNTFWLYGVGAGLCLVLYFWRD